MKEWIKGAIKSWTIWFNSIMAFIFSYLDGIQAMLPQLQQFVPDIKWIALFVILTNIALRVKTKDGLKEKGQT